MQSCILLVSEIIFNNRKQNWDPTMPFFFFLSVMQPKAQRMQSASWKQSNSQGTACQDSSEHSLVWICRHVGLAVHYWHCCHGFRAEELLGVGITRTPGPLQLRVSNFSAFCFTCFHEQSCPHDYKQHFCCSSQQRSLSMSDSHSLCRTETFEALSWDA